MLGVANSLADQLFEIAEGQQGYFTAQQAATVGYKLGSQAHHVKAGNWLRVERGVYRLARFPQSSEEQLVIYALWSRNRSGKPEGVYSHQTALSIHELSDLNPTKLHMTVPPSFRRTAPPPALLRLYHASLEEDDVEQRQGFSVTRPLRSITDVANANSVSREFVEQALVQARQRGLITARQISDLCGHGEIPGWFRKALSRHSR